MVLEAARIEEIDSSDNLYIGNIKKLLRGYRQIGIYKTRRNHKFKMFDMVIVAHDGKGNIKRVKKLPLEDKTFLKNFMYSS